MSAPEETGAPTAEPTLASRLGESHVGLRPDLQVSRHVFRGEVAYVLQDPITFASHRVTSADYQVLMRLSDDKPLAEIFRELVEDETLLEGDEERFYQFALSLHRMSFLQLPITDERALYRRHQAKRRAKRMQRVTSIFFFQVPLFDPSRFLDRTIGAVRHLFTRAAFAIWLALVGTAAYLVAHNWHEFTRPVGDIFSSGNIPLLWVTLIVLKALHELGHAYACRAFGGHVPEMGLYLIVLTPSAYVDATAAWGFRRKLHRIVVCLAGMYVELAIAAVAVVVWSAVEPGALRSLAHNVVMLASVVTVGFNINPLMRFDGYYAFSDMIEVPNLRQKATEYTTGLVKRIVLGVRTQALDVGFGMKALLAGYGVSAAVYKVTLVLGISAMIATKFFAVGLLLGATYLMQEVLRTARRALPYLWSAEETAPVRFRAVALSLLVLVGLPLGLFWVPLPARVVAPGTVRADQEFVVRAEASGFLVAVDVFPGDRIERGDRLAELEDTSTAVQLLEAEALRRAAELRLASARSEDPIRIQQEEERVEQANREVDGRRFELEHMSIRSSGSGRVVGGLRARDVGRFVRRGDPIATVASGELVVRAFLTGADLVRAHPDRGGRVEFRAASDPSRSWSGTIERILVAGSTDHPFLNQLAKGEVPIDPATGKATTAQFEVAVSLDAAEAGLLRHGMTGRLRVGAESEPLGRRLQRQFLRFAHRLRNGG